MRAALGAALLATLALLPSYARAQDCPDGQVSVGQGRCARDMSRGPFINMRAPSRGKRSGPPPCPQGTHTVESQMGYRCVMGSGDGDKPALARDTGRRGPVIVTDGAAAAAATVTPAGAPPAAEPQLEKVLASDAPLKSEAAAPSGPPKDFVPFKTKGLALSLPRGWHVTDAWSDEVPTIYVELDAKRRGKPVTMLISRLSPGQEGYEPLADAVAKEKEYQGAKEAAGRAVGGLQARQTVVAGESRSAYVDASAGVYYLLSYSAPKDVFNLYEPAYEKMLSTARFVAR